jgi:NCAIR mutase (PurE)-related protein
MKSNKEQIAELVKEMLNESHEAMIKKIDKILRDEIKRLAKIKK